MKHFLDMLLRRQYTHAATKETVSNVFPCEVQLPLYKDIYRTFSHFTMINEDKYIDTLCLLNDWASGCVPHGAVVECGCWRGGMTGGIAKLLGAIGPYHLFDSFEGLPPAQPIDGTRARDWQTDTNGPKYHNNCRAEKNEAEAAMRLTDVKWSIHQGWFQDTFPDAKIDTISLLRLDGDWYDSTMLSLETFFPRLQEGGILLIDDYYIWEGCCRAVHDYLSGIQSTSRIKSRNQVCYLIKTEAINEHVHTP